MELVLIDVWGYRGYLVPEQYKGRRVGWTDVWFRSEPGSNPYANPVNGLHCIVDLNAMQLLEIEDTFEVDRPQVMGEYVPRFVPGMTPREIKPIEVSQPEGPSFTLDGHALSWQNWTLRLGFNHREGLVLHELGFADGGRVRPVAHRLSIAEMVVPYRDPTLDQYRRTAYDIGEWGLGFMTTSLELGCDCLGDISYLDAVLHNTAGEPYMIKNAICIHEEDDGVLWKHVDHQHGAEVRRMRRLVISVHVTVANYEYLVYWRLYQDGEIECDIHATGIMVVSHLPEGEPARWGTMVDQRTYAPFHQHFLIARLDLDVDGESNTVHMVETAASGVSDEDPYGLGLKLTSVPLRTESEGRQDYRWESQRSWKVVNEGSLNAVGSPVAYKLVPGGALPHMLPDDSPVLKTAEALRHTLWVTPYAAAERWPCGAFPNQSSEDTGLPVWTAADRSIADTDVVLWYVFGIHHVTRVEDWPIMPVDAVSFSLKPFGFFDRNPALDVPPPASACH
jgi:primary-amine oxidase